MSETGDQIGHLRLIGYEKLTDHGFALPVFGQSPDANVFCTARSTLPGEPDGQIAEFEPYDVDALVRLPSEEIRETGVGEPWLDVFLWKGVAYVGTGRQIWDALTRVRADIEEHAPLSLLGLAEQVPCDEASRLARRAFSWLTSRYGREKALEWRRETYLRGRIVKILRRELGASLEKAEIHRALQGEVVAREHGDKISFFIGSRFSFVNHTRLDPVACAAANVGAKVEFIIQQVAVLPPQEPAVMQVEMVRRRTSENEMRIAALRVAASKPSGKATTTELKYEVDRYVALTAEDRVASKTRPSEAMYQQIVGNIVSHRESKNNIFAKGWAIYTGDGIQITDAGRRHLRMLGLLSES
jgi:hypothetical protein